MDLFVTRLQATHAAQELTPPGGLEVSQFGAQQIELVLGAPLSVGTLMNLTLELRGGPRPVTLDAVGKVAAQEAGSAGGARVRLQLRQFDNDVWAAILDVLRDRQGRADEIFTKVKGES